jgi:hypothetical protein
MDARIILLFAIIIIIAGAAFFIVTFGKNGDEQLDVEKYQKMWLDIEQSLSKTDVSSYHLSIINADKLLDQALKEKGVRGETMGYRLKNTKFSYVNDVWDAHIKIDYPMTVHALRSFKQALKDLGAI